MIWFGLHCFEYGARRGYGRVQSFFIPFCLPFPFPFPFPPSPSPWKGDPDLVSSPNLSDRKHCRVNLLFSFDHIIWRLPVMRSFFQGIRRRKKEKESSFSRRWPLATFSLRDSHDIFGDSGGSKGFILGFIIEEENMAVERAGDCSIWTDTLVSRFISDSAWGSQNAFYEA